MRFKVHFLGPGGRLLGGPAPLQKMILATGMAKLGGIVVNWCRNAYKCEAEVCSTGCDN